MRIATVAHRLAVSCWLGGAALYTFVLTPTIFRAYDRDQAGAAVGLLMPGYFRWGLACGAVALLCLAGDEGRRKGARAALLAAMLAVAAAQAFVVEPRAVELKKEIPSFVTTPAEHPARRQFRTLHAASQAGNLGVIGGAIALVVLF